MTMTVRRDSAMVEMEQAGNARIWRGIRIFGTSLLGLFLIGVASGYTVAHLDEGRGFDLRTIAVIGVVLACLAGCGLLIRRDVRAFLAADSSIHGGGGEGERLYADQRKRFWTIIGGLAAIGAITGFVGSFVVVNDMLHIGASPQMLTLAAAGIVLVAILSAYGSWRFFVTVDELELADNLWGSLIGFYAYAILFPAWWALNRVGRAPEPNDWVIYLSSVAIALTAYGYRKWRYR